MFRSVAKYDISVIIPSIRVQNLEKIHFMLERGIEPFSFETIVISPYELPDAIKTKDSVKYFKDFGSPSRCVQIASTLVEGKYMCWLSDDCVFITPNSLAQCVQILEDNSEKDAVTLRYFEGEGFNEFPLDYWNAKYHDDMKQLPGIKEHYRIAPLGMYNTKQFREIGGLDCRYEHINICTHDLAFRVQENGGKIHMSPQTVARFYWSWHHTESKPVQDAYFLNDRDFFQKQYGQDISRTKIDYWNWMNVPSKWVKRFG